MDQTRGSIAAEAAIGHGVVTYSAEGRCTWANKAASELLDIPPERLLKQDFPETEFAKACGLPAQAGAIPSTLWPVQWDTPYLLELGATRCRDFQLSRIETSGESSILVVITDVTDRRRAEEALRANEERYRGLADATPDLVFSFDADLNLTGINRAAARSLHLQIDEATGRHVTDLGLPQDLERRWMRKCSEVLARGEPAERLLNEFALADGQTHLNETSLWPVQAADGTVVGVRGVTRDVTERKQAEELLRESEQRYHSLFEAANDGLMVHTLDGRILETNSVLSERLGYGAEELLTMNVLDLRNAEASPLYFAHMDDVRVRGRAVFETTHVRRDGSTVPVEISSRLIEAAGREMVLSISRDVTERREAEEALRLTQLSVDCAGDFIHWIGRDGRVHYASDSSCRRLGYSREEMLTKTIFDLDPIMPPDAWPEHWLLVKRCGSVTFESLFQTKAGEAFPVEISANHVESAGREFVFGFARDITERKQMEAALKESEERYRLLADATSDLIYSYDTTLELTGINRAAARSLGLEPSEALGKPLDQLGFPEPTLAQWKRMTQEVINTRNAVREVVEVAVPPGESFFYDTVLQPVMDAGGDIVGFRGGSRDITERKRAEKALHESEQQLRQAQKMEAVGQLAGGIAHDFNNLLTVIIGNSSLMQASMNPEDANLELVADIREVAERAAALTRQILAFSRRQLLKPEVLLLNDVVTSLDTLLKRTLGEDIDLSFSMAPDLLRTEVDPHQIEQVLLNLALNSRDAMPSGGILRVETNNVRLDTSFCEDHSGIQPGAYVVLSVSDTGIGMDEEVKSHIFEPFFTTKEVGKGTGLGLSTVFGIVKQSGGSVFVYSEPGQGTTFKVYLPVAQTDADEIDGVLPVVDTKGGAETILVVEDEPSVQELVVRILCRAGYQVLRAGSMEHADMALEQVASPPDLLLTDVILPGGSDGRGLAEKLCGLYPDLKVIFMSGYTRGSVVHDGRLDEDIEFLEKPFTPDALLTKVRAVLDAIPGRGPRGDEAKARVT